jgi:hypothetical protein
MEQTVMIHPGYTFSFNMEYILLDKQTEHT